MEVNCEFPQKCTPLFLIEVDVKGFSILPFERLRAKGGDCDGQGRQEGLLKDAGDPML